MPWRVRGAGSPPPGPPARTRSSSARNGMRLKRSFPSRQASISTTAPINPIRMRAYASWKGLYRYRCGRRLPVTLRRRSPRRNPNSSAPVCARSVGVLPGKCARTYWQARLAATEQEVAQRKVDEAVALAADVERRLKAGDLARTDHNQARSAEQLARAAFADTRGRAYRATQAFFVLTGLKSLPAVTESVAVTSRDLDRHPQLDATDHAAATARAKLGQATVATRDPLEIEVGMRRERSAFGEAVCELGHCRDQGAVLDGFPQSAAYHCGKYGAHRGAGHAYPRAAEAAADIDAAESELEQAREIEQLAAERFRLAMDTQALFVKAFTLGELDLSARLRAESERFDAELALTRTRIEIGRAISRLDQALGVFP